MITRCNLWMAVLLFFWVNVVTILNVILEVPPRNFLTHFQGVHLSLSNLQELILLVVSLCLYEY